MTRRRILVLAPFAPRHDAVHGGGRLMAQEIEALAAHHDVALLCLRAADDPPTDERLRRCCDVVEEMVRSTTLPSPRRRAARWARLLMALARGEPMWVADWREPRYAQRLRALVREWRPDVLQLEYHVMGQYLHAADDAPPSLLVVHEPGHATACERWRIARGPARWARARDARAWERFERALLTRVDAAVAFTTRDAAALSALAPRAVECIAPGTRLPECPLSALGTPPPALLFVGNFGHPPNRDAALRLATAIHPRLRARFPALRLVLVGDAPPRALRARASAHVEVTGRVADVTPFLDRAAVVVAPLRQGGGMRVKVLEAFAAGKAVVASPLALEGLGAVSAEHCLAASSDDEIVAAVSTLLDDPALRARLAGAARAHAAAHFGWTRAVAAYDAVYARMQGTAAAAVPRNAAAGAAPPVDAAVAAAVSVAVATLDRPQALARCLEALVGGAARPGEIIVVDQGAGDGVRALVTAIDGGGVTIRYHHQDRRGLSASRNAALALATHPVLAVTDDDCVPDARWVGTIARTFAAPGAPDVVTGRVLPFGDEVPGSYAVASRTGTRRIDHDGRALPWAVGTGGNVAARCEWLTRIGGYDERLGAGSPGGAGEDTDLLYRLLRAGARVRYEPDAIVYHERQSRARRLSTRTSYGRGIGACCAVWLRRGDAHALALLVRWLASRTRRMLRAVARADSAAIREELLVLSGTITGVIYGATLDRAAPARARITTDVARNAGATGEQGG